VERKSSFDSGPCFKELTEEIDDEKYKIAYLFSPAGKPMQAAARLLQRLWFRRLWVAREILLSSSLKLL